MRNRTLGLGSLLICTKRFRGSEQSNKRHGASKQYRFDSSVSIGHIADRIAGVGTAVSVVGVDTADNHRFDQYLNHNPKIPTSP